MWPPSSGHKSKNRKEPAAAGSKRIRTNVVEIGTAAKKKKKTPQAYPIQIQRNINEKYIQILLFELSAQRMYPKCRVLQKLRVPHIFP
jgi:hypothetical protein